MTTAAASERPVVKLSPRLEAAIGKTKLAFLRDHPELRKGAVEFGFDTSAKAQALAAQSAEAAQ